MSGSENPQTKHPHRPRRCLAVRTSLFGLIQLNAPKEDAFCRRIIARSQTQDHFRKMGNRPVIPVSYPVVRLGQYEEGPYLL